MPKTDDKKILNTLYEAEGETMKELSLNILDITQNSITADAKNISIEIRESTAENQLSIIITDDGCGMDAETLAKVTDPFYTGRTTRKVGLGLPLYKMAAEMTGGSFSIESKKGAGTKNIAVFKTDSVDFIPLGDVISTVCILISGSPDIDFIFRHSKDGTEILLDTKQLRGVLGSDISLSAPEVIEWINGYLVEQYAAF